MLIQMRILFVKLSSIGDIVHTLPALAALRKKLPEAEFSWVVERSAADILRNNTLLSNVFEIDTRSLRRRKLLGKTIKSAKKQLRELRESEFDIALDFQGLFKSATISRVSGTKFRAGFSKKHLREPACRHLYTHRFKVDPTLNVIYKNMMLAEKSVAAFLNKPHFQLEKSNLEFPIESDQSERSEARDIALRMSGDFVLLNPAGGWSTKLWPAENYGKLADRIWSAFGLESIICTAPSETDLANVAASSSSSGRTTTAHPSLKGFYELSKLAKGYVGGDTAPTHLAVAAGCPVVGIFGPTEWWRNGSPMPADLSVVRDDIGCRTDCGRRSCGNWICMDISVDKVLLGFQARLGL